MKKVLLAKVLLAMVLVLAFCVPAFADSNDGWYIQNGTTTSYYYDYNPGSGWTKLSSGVGNPNPPVGNIGGGTGGTANGLYQSPISIANGPGALSPTATGGSVGAITNTNTANGGQGGAGGSGGNVVISPNAVNVHPTISPTISPVITVKPEINVNPTIDTTDVNVNINRPVNNNSNVIEKGAVRNTNRQEQNQDQRQKQNQSQAQDQSMNNGQTVAPVQTTTIITEKPFTPIPMVGVPELNFGNGHMIDVSRNLPRFKGVTLLKSGDTIHTVVDVVANVPLKRLYKTILKLANENSVQTPYMRFQIIKAEGQKSWTSGGSFGGGATGVAGNTGVAGGSSFIPSVGGTKAHDLFTIMVVAVIPE